MLDDLRKVFETLQVSLLGWLASSLELVLLRGDRIFLTFWTLIPCSIYISMLVFFLHNDMDNAEMQMQKQFFDYCFH